MVEEGGFLGRADSQGYSLVDKAAVKHTATSASNSPWTRCVSDLPCRHNDVNPRLALGRRSYATSIVTTGSAPPEESAILRPAIVHVTQFFVECFPCSDVVERYSDHSVSVIRT
jgi:hypothetical protein